MIKIFLHQSVFTAAFSLALIGMSSATAFAQAQAQAKGQVPSIVNCNRAEACAFTLPSEHPMPVTFTLSVTSEVKSAPDMAMISFGVVTTAKTAAEALKANNIRMNNVLASMKSFGIEAKSLQTSSFSATPQYTYNEGRPPQITGYQITNQVTVRVENLSNLGTTIDAVTLDGVNQIEAISFDVKNDSSLLDTARKDAVDLLNKRAQLYATALGYSSYELVSLSENGAIETPSVAPGIMMVKRAGNETTPISNGEISRTITLNAVFELKK